MKERSPDKRDGWIGYCGRQYTLDNTNREKDRNEQ